jgi:4-aminobutyrate--pyruvate transaminase
MANLDIIEERDLVGAADRLAPRFQGRLAEFTSHENVGEARGEGLIGALEFVADKPTKAPFEAPGAFGARLAELCQEEGLIVRAIGDIVAFCPPLIISQAEIDEMFNRFGKALKRM